MLGFAQSMAGTSPNGFKAPVTSKGRVDLACTGSTTSTGCSTRLSSSSPEARRTPPPDDRVLATVLFTDIVDSTRRAAELGDQRWRELLDAHDAIVRRAVDQARGRIVKSTGDRVMATFDGPARAIR